MSLASHLNSSMKKHHAAHKKSPPAKKKVSHFQVDPASDGSGFVVKTHTKSDTHDYEEPSTSIHKNLSSVKKHMESMCGSGDDGEE